MPLTTENAAPVFGDGNPPVWVDENIAICDRKAASDANAAIYTTADVDFWADLLRKYLGEGLKVAVVGENAQAVVDRYMQT